MTATTDEQLEIEIKLDVPADFVLPDLSWPARRRRGRTDRRARPGRDLLRHRRTCGWPEPASRFAGGPAEPTPGGTSSTRRSTRRGSRSTARSVARPGRRRARSSISPRRTFATRPLVPVATLVTTPGRDAAPRRRRLRCSPSVADDRVEGQRIAGTARRPAWPGARSRSSWSTATGRSLPRPARASSDAGAVRVGARPPSWPACSAPARPREPAAERADLATLSTAGAVVRRHLADQVAALVRWDPLARVDAPGRRAQDAGGDPPAAQRARDVPPRCWTGPSPTRSATSCKWLGQVLGGPRDEEVMHARLRRPARRPAEDLRARPGPPPDRPRAPRAPPGAHRDAGRRARRRALLPPAGRAGRARGRPAVPRAGRPARDDVLPGLVARARRRVLDLAADADRASTANDRDDRAPRGPQGGQARAVRGRGGGAGVRRRRRPGSPRRWSACRRCSASTRTAWSPGRCFVSSASRRTSPARTASRSGAARPRGRARRARRSRRTPRHSNGIAGKGPRWLR